LRGVCEAAGLVLGVDGCFHSLNDNGAEEFRITNIGSERFVADNIKSLATHGVTLTIDVPRVADGAAAFTRLINTAQQLARGLGGVVVDTQRVPLADAMAAGIRGKIVELQQQMKAADIPPGSTRAFKLFS
jgi:FtsZ-interacting cell division protein ZipA